MARPLLPPLPTHQVHGLMVFPSHPRFFCLARRLHRGGRAIGRWVYPVPSPHVLNPVHLPCLPRIRGRKRCEPSQCLKEGARGKSDISHVLLATWRAMKEMDEIELQIHCLRIKVDSLKVQRSN